MDSGFSIATLFIAGKACRKDNMEKFTVKNGKKLKYGFTTGSCAAAAAAAAAAMLFSGEKVSEAEVILPAGQ